VGDAISSVGVIVAAVLISFTGAHWIDPFISILIGAIIFFSAFRVLRSSLHILLEGVPEGLSLKQINTRMRSIGTVDSVHDLHIWNLGSEHVALSAHVTLDQTTTCDTETALSEIKSLLNDEFNIQHTTIQFENAPCQNGHGGCN
jgi:cobalt-zinc-cadmium efflux system protein